MKIFGYDFEEIRQAQQGGTLGKTMPRMTGKEHAIQIASDIEKFHIPVYDSVKESLQIELPAAYVKNGNRWEWNSRLA